jgi:hypothetical protein
VLAAPFILTLDYAKFDFGIPDVLTMVGPGFWAFFALSAGLLIVARQTSPRSFWPMFSVLSSAPFILFSASQLPLIIGWDQYSHAAIAREFDIGAVIHGGYDGYPGAFILLNSASRMQDMDLLLSGSVLAPALRVLALILVYLIARTLLGKEKALLVIPIFLVGNIVFDFYTYYCAQLFGICMYLLCIYVYTRSLQNTHVLTYRILLILTAVVLIISHPFSSLLLVLSLASIHFVRLALKAKELRVGSQLLALVLVAWLSWQVYAATVVTGYELGRVLVAMKSGFFFFEVLGPSVTSGYFIHNTILDSYRKMIHMSVGFLGMAALISTRNRTSTRMYGGLVFAVILLSCLFFLIAEPSDNVWFDRTMLFGYIPASALASVGLLDWLRVSLSRISSRFDTRVFRWGAHLAPVLLMVMILLSFMATFQTTYGDTIHAWETAPVAFLARSVQSETQPKVLSDEATTAAVYRYYQPNPKIQSVDRFANKVGDFYARATGQFIIRSFRQEVQWYYTQGVRPEEWDTLDKQMLWNPHFNRMLDNSYVQIYDGTL